MALLIILLILSACPLTATASDLPVTPAAEGIIVTNDRWPSTASLKRFGEDCIRLAGATTDQEKAIAVWRCTIMSTGVTRTAPAEPALGLKYIANPMKLLNVYGGHWCDGLSRIMEMTWRALGYRADKLYKFGHTFADMHYRDADGIARWHVFDPSQRWFVYDRSGKHISTADEQALNHSLTYYPSRTPVPDQPSPMPPSYVHTGHLQFEPYTPGITLRTGEEIEFNWGNDGISYFNIFGKNPKTDALHGPYPVTYGSGQLLTRPLAELDAIDEYSARTSVDIAASPDGKGGSELHPKSAGKTAALVIKVALPYIISDVALDATVFKKAQEDEIAVFISADNGMTWRKYWEAQESVDRQEIRGAHLSEPFDAAGTKPLPRNTAFGRYDYLLKIEMKAAANPQDCRIEGLVIHTRFQHNLFSLPMLWPGRNEISIEGNLRSDRALSVTYAWVEAGSADRTRSWDITRIPIRQVIEAKGREWEDVRCRTLRIAAVPRSHEGDAGLTVAAKSGKPGLTPYTAVATGRIIGTTRAPKPVGAATLIRRIEDAIRHQGQTAISDGVLKAMAGQVGDDILALGALRDPSARDVLERVIMEDKTHAFHNRVWAMQALYNTIGKEAAPILIKVLRKDAAIVFYDPNKEWSADAMWLHAAATAAAALAATEDLDKKADAADLIAAALQNRMTSTPLRKIWRGEEIEWGLIRALGTLGERRHGPILYGYLTPGNDSDAMAEALTALARMGAGEALPQIVLSLRSFKYLPVGLHAVAAIGKFGGSEEVALILPLLRHWDEEMRAAAAQALAAIGGADILDQLKSAMDMERIGWVHEVMKAAVQSAEQKK